MAALKLSWPCWTLALVAVTASTFADQRIFTRHTGMNVTVTFPVASGTASLWLKRPGSDNYILYCKDGTPTRLQDQEESFKGRVTGTDCDKVDNIFSLTVSDLIPSDSGTYVFRWVGGDGNDSNQTIFLHVSDPGQTGGHTEGGGKKADGAVGLIVGLAVSGLVLLGIGGLIFMRTKKNSYLPPAV